MDLVFDTSEAKRTPWIRHGGGFGVLLATVVSDMEIPRDAPSA